jgi:DNA adenine methylase
LAARAISGCRARPFLKWAGGKTQLLSQFQQYYPRGLADSSITRYIEPFLGSGAVFLDIVQKFSLSDAVLFDANGELILVYRVVQQKPNELIALLQELSQTYLALSEDERRSYFYKVREAYNAQRTLIAYEQPSDDWILRAARMIFLNKTCFNGLFRVNSKGEFNVPFGRYKRPAIVNEENILCVSKLLQNATLRVGSYEQCARFVNGRSFVYFDPPYRPLSATSNFTSYSKNKFDDQDQIKLAQFFAHLSAKTTAHLMLSNSDPHNAGSGDMFFDKLYAGFNIHRVFANRMINANARARGKISELLITNY